MPKRMLEPFKKTVRSKTLGLPQKKAPPDLLRETKRVQGRLATVNKD